MEAAQPTSLTLLQRARANDQEAWRRLVHLYTPLVRFWLQRGGVPPADGDDLVQEAFLRLLTEVAAGRQPVHLRAWLFRVGTNLAASRGRREGVATRRAHELLRREVASSPEDELLDREEARDVHGRLAALPPSARRALLLAAHGYTGAEIAAYIGRTPLATRSLICRARGRLRDESAAA